MFFVKPKPYAHEVIRFDGSNQYELKRWGGDSVSFEAPGILATIRQHGRTEQAGAGDYLVRNTRTGEIRMHTETSLRAEYEAER